MICRVCGLGKGDIPTKEGIFSPSFHHNIVNIIEIYNIYDDHIYGTNQWINCLLNGFDGMDFYCCL